MNQYGLVVVIMDCLKLNIFAVLCGCAAVFADFELQHTVIFSIEPINQMGLIEGPAPIFSLCSCNSTTSTNTYSISTNETNKKISGYLDASMPAGTTLSVNLSPPSGARSMGEQALSAVPVDLVIEISMVFEVGLPMVYTFSADSKKGVLPSETRIITYTLTDG